MKNKEYLIIIILLMAIIIGVFSNLYFVSKNKRETNIIKTSYIVMKHYIMTI